MSYDLDFHPEALAELGCVTGDYEAKQPELGVRFRQVVERTCQAIVANPHFWRERAMGYRRVNLPGFSYFIAFILDGDRILVVAVPHSSRKPDYWANRFPVNRRKTAPIQFLNIDAPARGSCLLFQHR